MASPTFSSSLTSEEVDAALQRLGFDAFRTGQREAITTLLDVGRLLLVAPTGGGKSLTYQLPGTALPGTTLVISPLIALMNDQVQGLTDRGVSATFLASTLKSVDIRSRMAGMARGEFKLVYVAPERLRAPGFRSLLADIECPLVAVDEAHCISEWGHDFRPEYMEIGELVQSMPHARTLACTATATPIVRDEILSRLGLGAETPQHVTGFARPNLSLRVTETPSKAERVRTVDRLLTETLDVPGSGKGTAIVYAPTRKSTEEEAARLKAAGWASGCYHAGMSPAARDKSQRAFLSGKLEVAVATNAFGMGIDRADVRAVAHLAPPSSIEAYYQEVGRAGRDGDPAVGMLCVSPGDMPLRRHLIESDVDGRAANKDVVAHKWNLFLELMRWAEGGTCRHDAILRYFGDEEEMLAGCGSCDICLQLAEPDARSPEDVAIIVRKSLSAVARLRGRFGLSAATKLLRGVDDDRLIRTGLDQTKTFGALSDCSEEWLTRLLRRCVTAGWVDFQGGDRPVAVITEAGMAAIKGTRTVSLVLPAEHATRSSRTKLVARRGQRATVDPDDWDEIAEDAFQELRAHRLDLSRSEGVPPYVVASDRTLRDLAVQRPTTLDGLLDIHGIGPAKVDRYGEGFLEILRSVTAD